MSNILIKHTGKILVYIFNLGNFLLIQLKENFIFEKLNSLIGKNPRAEISFEVLESNGIKLEDIEEFLFIDKVFRIYKISVDYERSVIVVKYIIKGKEHFRLSELENVNGKIKELRNKLQNFAKKIDEITI